MSVGSRSIRPVASRRADDRKVTTVLTLVIFESRRGEEP